jgi:hypothetical protein
MTDNELINALGKDLGLRWAAVFEEDKGEAVREAAREYIAARAAFRAAETKLFRIAS